MKINRRFLPFRRMRELSLLEELERNPVVSQRALSKKFDMALGVTNACLNRMIRQGWIWTGGYNHHRMGYFLSPTGVEEKIKLSSDLISWRVQHYSFLKEMFRRRLIEIKDSGIERIAFYGMGDEMEIAYISLQGLNLKLVGIIENPDEKTSRSIWGYELTPLHQVERLTAEAILVTRFSEVEEKMERLKKLKNFGFRIIWLVDGHDL